MALTKIMGSLYVYKQDSLSFHIHSESLKKVKKQQNQTNKKQQFTTTAILSSEVVSLPLQHWRLQTFVQ